MDAAFIEQRLAELNKAWREQFAVLSKIEGRVDELLYLLNLLNTEGEQSPSDSSSEVSDGDDSSLPS